MKPTKFKQANVIFAKDQPEYLQLPAYKADDGRVVTCWKLSMVDRIRVLFTGRLWLGLMTFNNPLQPIIPSTKTLFAKEKANGTV